MIKIRNFIFLGITFCAAQLVGAGRPLVCPPAPIKDTTKRLREKRNEHFSLCKEFKQKCSDQFYGLPTLPGEETDLGTLFKKSNYYYNKSIEAHKAIRESEIKYEQRVEQSERIAAEDAFNRQKRAIQDRRTDEVEELRNLLEGIRSNGR